MAPCNRFHRFGRIDFHNCDSACVKLDQLPVSRVVISDMPICQVEHQQTTFRMSMINQSSPLPAKN